MPLVAKMSSLLLISFGVAIGFGVSASGAGLDLSDGTWSVTPRVQETFTDLQPEVDLVGRADPSAKTTISRLDFPFAGLTIQYSPSGGSDDYILSGYYGSGDGTATVVAPTVVPGIGNVTFIGSGHYSSSRTDIEGLVRHRFEGHYFEDSSIYLLYGGRYVHIGQDLTIPGGAFPETGTDTFRSSVETYVAEFGGGGNIPLDADRVANLFGNFIFGVQWNRLFIDNSINQKLFHSFVGPAGDFSVGATYSLTGPDNRIVIAGRYRATVVAISGTWTFVITHGPEIGLTFKF